MRPTSFQTLRRATCALLATLTATSLMTAASAQSVYPSRPIKMIVPFPAAGTADVVARLVGAKIGEQLGQPVIIDNRVGANGNIGTDAAAKSPADGYTLLLGSTPNMTINPALYAKMPFDAQKDFQPVLALGSSANVLVVNPKVPASTMQEFLALARTRGTPILFASGGNGSTGHLAMEMLAEATGVKFLHVPYKGGPQAVTDLMGGQVEALFFPAPAVLQQVKAGKLKALAVASTRRSGVMPEVPTIAESGVPNFDASPWFGLFVPTGTPKDVVDKLQAAASNGLASESVRKEFAVQGIEPMTETGDAFTGMVKHDLVRWADVVKKSGATVD